MILWPANHRWPAVSKGDRLATFINDSDIYPSDLGIWTIMEFMNALTDAPNREDTTQPERAAREHACILNVRKNSDNTYSQ